MTTKHPSELCQDFQDDRLRFLAELFSATRDAALDLYRPEEGENPWDLGCRCYSRTTFALEQAAGSGEHPWLTILQPRVPGKQFIFKVGQQPVRFYTGSSARPNPRSLRCEHMELHALELALPDQVGTKATEWLWRIAIGVDQTGHVAQVAVLQTTRGGSVRNPYSIPFSRNEAGVIVPMPLRSGIEMEKPDVGTWEDDIEAADEKARGSE